MSNTVKANTLGTCALTFAAATLLLASCSTDYSAVSLLTLPLPDFGRFLLIVTSGVP